tara:strand:- start:2489 stop:3709 length:1221 start_codon:yes stop_codon:yes gene_type:complete
MPKSPDEVFRPGSPDPGGAYVERSELESQIDSFFGQSRAGLLTGISGSGKTWLYKKCLERNHIRSCSLNLQPQYPKRIEDLAGVELGKRGQFKARSANRKFGLKAVIGWFGGTAESSNTLEARDEDVVYELIKYLQQDDPKTAVCLVIENIEQGLMNPQSLHDLRALIMKMTDEPFTSMNAHLLLVSANMELLSRLTNVEAGEAIIRRIEVFSEVTSFSEDEAKKLIEEGFEKQLKMRISQKGRFLESCRISTAYRPDYMQQFCLEVANIARAEKNTVSKSVIDKALSKWEKTRLAPYKKRINNFMNQGDTKKSARDKIMIVISDHGFSDHFTPRDVLRELERRFPDLKFQQNEVTRALNFLGEDLKNGSRRILEKDDSDKNPLFRFSDHSTRIACSFFTRPNELE